jgi:holo-[acyl-carrier protein] synthase
LQKKFSVGIDLIEIARIERSMKNKRFMERVFSQEELKYFAKRKFAPQTVAGRFCVKEAFAKALGCGVCFPLSSVSTLPDENGKPVVTLTGKAKQLAENAEISVSISHSKTHATAVVLLAFLADIL